MTFFRRFESFNQGVTFDTAKQRCENRNGRLAEPRNQQQLNALIEINIQHFWLGATYSRQIGIWRWSSDNAILDSVGGFWNAGEPSQGSNENCLQFFEQGQDDGNCFVMLPYVCEFGGIGPVSICIS